MLSSEESQRSCAFSFGQDERELVIESTSANEVRMFVVNSWLSAHDVTSAMLSFLDRQCVHEKQCDKELICRACFCYYRRRRSWENRTIND